MKKYVHGIFNPFIIIVCVYIEPFLVRFLQENALICSVFTCLILYILRFEVFAVSKGAFLKKPLLRVSGQSPDQKVQQKRRMNDPYVFYLL